jgi:hypothetical protein
MPVKNYKDFVSEETSDLSIVPKEMANGDMSEEQEMAIGQLKSAIDHASELINLIGNVKDLEAWVQSKITTAADYIETVHSYMQSRLDNKDENPK